MSPILEWRLVSVVCWVQWDLLSEREAKNFQTEILISLHDANVMLQPSEGLVCHANIVPPPPPPPQMCLQYQYIYNFKLLGPD